MGRKMGQYVRTIYDENIFSHITRYNTKETEFFMSTAYIQGVFGLYTYMVVNYYEWFYQNQTQKVI